MKSHLKEIHIFHNKIYLLISVLYKIPSIEQQHCHLCNHQHWELVKELIEDKHNCVTGLERCQVPPCWSGISAGEETRETLQLS